jgi:hypothetical protein
MSLKCCFVGLKLGLRHYGNSANLECLRTVLRRTVERKREWQADQENIWWGGFVIRTNQQSNWLQRWEGLCALAQGQHFCGGSVAAAAAVAAAAGGGWQSMRPRETLGPKEGVFMITCERISSNFGESIRCSRIPRRVWNLNVRGRVHKSMSQASVLSLMTSSPQANILLL